MPVFDEKREELVHLAGDAADYAGSGQRGLESNLNLNANVPHPQVRYRDKKSGKDFLMTCDVYAFPGTPMKVIMICPRCHQTLTVSAENKRIEFDPTARVADGGRLSIEPFKCTWEADSTGRRMEFGLGLCGWTVGIDDNVAKDA